MSEELTQWQSIERAANEDHADDMAMGHALGKRDGFQDAVAIIDFLTGGDGEYRYNTTHDPERHCPDPDAMIARIVERFNTRSTPAPPAADVERVARAIHDARFTEMTPVSCRWSFADDSNKEYCYRLALAALAALPTPAAVADSVESEAEARGRRLYDAETSNHPTIHCNRFPPWDELSHESKQSYIDRAASLPDPPASTAQGGGR